MGKAKRRSNVPLKASQPSTANKGKRGAPAAGTNDDNKSAGRRGKAGDNKKSGGKRKRTSLKDRTTMLVNAAAAARQADDDDDARLLAAAGETGDFGDVSYFSGGGAALLSSMQLDDAGAGGRKKKKKQQQQEKQQQASTGIDSDENEGADDEDEEQDFEMKPRSWGASGSAPKTALPVFNKAGNLANRGTTETADPLAAIKPPSSMVASFDAAVATKGSNHEQNGKGEDEDDDGDYDSEEEEGGNKNGRRNEVAQVMSEAEALLKAKRLMAERKKRRKTIKEKMALSCVAVQQDPQGTYKTLGDVVRFCRDGDTAIVKLALVSCSALFKDITPGYRIREEESNKNGSGNADDDKAIKNYGKMRAFELAVLRSYGNYLGCLEQACKGRLLKGSRGTAPDPADVAQVRKIAVSCMAEMLRSHPHFNFTKRLMRALLPSLESKLVDLRSASKEAFSAVMREDISGENTVEVTRLVADEVKRRKYGSGQTSMSLLLEIRLREDLLKDTALQREVAKKRKSKKKNRDDDVAKEMAQAEAEHRRDRVMLNHQKILDTIFVTYARILKKATHSPLMPLVLRGVAKHGHLINVELLAEFISTLGDLLVEAGDNDGGGLGGDSSSGGGSGGLSDDTRMEAFLGLHSLKEIQGRALEVDFKQGYVFLYGLLRRIDWTSARSSSLAVRCCMRIFDDKKQVEPARIAAFIKRIASVCLEAPPHVALALLAVCRSMMETWPSTTQLLDADGSLMGTYNGHVDDPDFAMAFSSALWELRLLGTSHHPILAQVARQMLGGAAQLTIPGVGPLVVTNAERALRSFDASTGAFAPPVSRPKTYGLKNRYNKQWNNGELRHLPRVVNAHPGVVLVPREKDGEVMIPPKRVIAKYFGRKKTERLKRRVLWFQIMGQRYQEFKRRGG